jgi:hypothetical protein
VAAGNRTTPCDRIYRRARTRAGTSRCAPQEARGPVGGEPLNARQTADIASNNLASAFSRNEKLWNMRLELADQSGLMLASRITLPHFSV